MINGINALLSRTLHTLVSNNFFSSVDFPSPFFFFFFIHNVFEWPSDRLTTRSDPDEETTVTRTCVKCSFFVLVFIHSMSSYFYNCEHFEKKRTNTKRTDNLTFVHYKLIDSVHLTAHIGVCGNNNRTRPFFTDYTL